VCILVSSLKKKKKRRMHENMWMKTSEWHELLSQAHACEITTSRSSFCSAACSFLRNILFLAPFSFRLCLWWECIHQGVFDTMKPEHRFFKKLMSYEITSWQPIALGVSVLHPHFTIVWYRSLDLFCQVSLKRSPRDEYCRLKLNDMKNTISCESLFYPD